MPTRKVNMILFRIFCPILLVSFISPTDENTPSTMETTIRYNQTLPKVLRQGDELVIKGILNSNDTHFDIVLNNDVFALRMSIDYYIDSYRHPTFRKISLFVEEIKKRDSRENLIEIENFPFQRGEADFTIGLRVVDTQTFEVYGDGVKIVKIDTAGIWIENFQEQ